MSQSNRYSDVEKCNKDKLRFLDSLDYYRVVQGQI